MFQELSQALSIKFSHSEDDQFDMQSSPQKDKSGLKVKCFKCYGTNQNNCQECHGTSMIPANHPMAKLLDKILVKKLNLMKPQEQREEELEKVCPIKEQEQDSDQKKVMCKYCSKQIQFTYAESSESLLQKVCSGCNVKYTEIQQSIILSENVKYKSDLKLCKNCDCQIQNCYSICRTCEGMGIQYWICDQCSDNQSYNHDYLHLLEPVINFQPIQRRTSMVSQIFIEEQRQSIQNLQQLMVDAQLQHPILSITSSVQLTRKTLERSSVKVQFDGLFNSHHMDEDLKSTILKTHNANRKSLNQVVKRVRFGNQPSYGNCNKENFEKEQVNEADYVFTGYRCDYCSTEPILNIRYHCKFCQDFDLCQKCYKGKNYHHHESFDKIDGRLIRERAMQKILQYKEVNYLCQSQYSRYKKIAKSQTQRQLYETRI